MEDAHLAQLRATSNFAADLYCAPFPNFCSARLDDRSSLNHHVIPDRYTAQTVLRLLGSGGASLLIVAANLSTLVDNAPSSNVYASVCRVKPGSRMDDGLGLHRDRVYAGKRGFLGYSE